MYEGMGHEGLISDSRFLRDVLEFVQERPAHRQDRGAGTSVDRPSATSERPAGLSRVRTGAG